MSSRPILVIGASGAVGRPTIRHLVARGATIRALTSNKASAERLREAGVVETVEGDLRNSADLARALAGVGAVLFNSPRFIADETEIGRSAITLAREAGVERFVLNSVLHPELADLPHHVNKLRNQQCLIESGLDFAILQPAMFMQNLRVEWPRIQREGIYARPYSPDRPMALVDTDDLGEAAATVLLDPALIGGTYELCGPEPLTQAQMAAIIAEELGRPVSATRRDLAEWRNWAQANGWTPWAVETFAAMCTHYDRHGYAGGNPLVLEAILGRPATSYRDFVRRFLRDNV